MVKVVFQSNEKFYWIDHAEKFEPGSPTQIAKLNSKGAFYITIQRALVLLDGNERLVMHINECMQERC